MRSTTGSTRTCSSGGGGRIQTVTTVGYGDVAPRDVAGRIVATFAMLEGIALVASVTAPITPALSGRLVLSRAR